MFKEIFEMLKKANDYYEKGKRLKEFLIDNRIEIKKYAEQSMGSEINKNNYSKNGMKNYYQKVKGIIQEKNNIMISEAIYLDMLDKFKTAPTSMHQLALLQLFLPVLYKSMKEEDFYV